MKSSRGFTLIELVVVVGIILVLATLGISVAKKSMQSAEKAKEMNAGKNLITAFQSSSNDNDGRFMPAYTKAVGGLEITLPDGTSIQGEPLSRYPYRIAPYIQYQIKGVLLAGENAKRIDVGNHYNISLYPSFGMNDLFVGGRYENNGTNNYESETVSSRADASSSIIAFVTASEGGNSSSDGGKRMPGYFRVDSPKAPLAPWSASGWKPDSDPKDFGRIDARYGGKAITVFLDGSIRMMSLEELDDMRLWSVGAATADDPEYRPTKTSGGGGRL